MSENYNHGILLDVYYKEDSLFCTIKNKAGKKEDYLVDFYPYFYISFNADIDDHIFNKLKNKLDLKSISKENVSNLFFVYKLTFNTIEDLLRSRKILINGELILPNYRLHEFDIPFVYRFFVDYKVSIFRNVEFLLDESKKIIDIKALDKVEVDSLNQGCFDIEVLLSKNSGFPIPNEDPIISISYLNNQNKKTTFFLVPSNKEVSSLTNVLKKSSKVDDLFLFSDELSLVESFRDFLIKEDPDILFTYNGIFDFEYLSKFYKKRSGKELDLGKKRLVFSKKGRKKVHIEGKLHFDVYLLMRLLNYFQVFNYPKLDLNSLYANLTSQPKITQTPKEMLLLYKNKDYSKIIKYNQDDCNATLKLAQNYIGFVYEMAHFLNTSMYDLLYSSASSMVEKLFIKDYKKNNKIIPNKPTRSQIARRYQHKFSGAFVYQPSAGLYKDVAVLDFRSYHISLLISYNISPETIDIGSNSNYLSVLNHKIYKSPKGFVPSLLKKLLDLRMGFKKEMNTYKKNTTEYNSLYSKQYAIKILLASSYGYMGFAGSRWYCASCLDIMYHLVRSKIQKLISKFQDLGYLVVYGDTDSCFIHFKDSKKLESDLDNINSSLPEGMFLELENKFKTAIFVKSRSNSSAAKKKYAMLDYNNNLKIKGFEYVRRDWCPLVKRTQKDILEILLKKQDSKQAISYLRDVVDDLQNRKVDNKDLIIQSFIHKNISNYKSKNPAVVAYNSAKDKGIVLKSNDLIEYIITNKIKGSISDKARIYTEVEKGDYDINYYLNNQLIPSIFPILEVFNITKNELLTKTKQKDLSSFF